ncbi:MAG TPA: rhodanese-like domain-containing protein [Anaerolineales bacterium]|nr:rhodanese-like domain-containing protein [Anaerolineales bacterium]
MKRFLMPGGKGFILPATLIVLGLLLTACKGERELLSEAGGPVEVKGVQVSVPGGTYTDVSVQELQAMLQDNDFVFVNVHIPFEGDIPETDLSIPYDEIDQHLDQLPADKDAKIVLYCRSDRMSNIAATTLVGQGYTNVWNLDGGFNAWENTGLPIER